MKKKSSMKCNHSPYSIQTNKPQEDKKRNRKLHWAFYFAEAITKSNLR